MDSMLNITMAKLYYLKNVDYDHKLIIINELKKLNYYNFNQNKIIKRYTKQYICNNLDNHNLKIIDLIIQYKNTEEYKKLLQYTNHQLSRSIKLSKYLSTLNLLEFYKDCSLEELEYLGY